MKSKCILLLSVILGTQSLIAQEVRDCNKKSKSVVNFAQCVVANVLEINSEHTIDLVTLTDKKGRIVFQTKPVNNQISINTLELGFYLLCAYCNGVKVKKGIIKKVI